MNAAEAKRASEAIAQRIKQEKAAEAAKARITRIKQEKIRRKQFYQDFLTEINDSVKWAVGQGEKSTRVYVGKSVDTLVGAEEQLSKHKYLKEINVAIKKLKKDGFTVTTGTESFEHTTQHESTVPDYSYYTESAYIQIAWE
jgi:hypothetical protein